MIYDCHYLFGCEKSFSFVPHEGVSEFLSFNVHVEANGYQNFALGSVLVNSRRISIIKAQWECPNL